MLDLAIIIIAWNVRDDVLNALSSLYDDLAQSRLKAKVLVVDSASTDGTVEAIRSRFPQTDILVNERNVGFGSANNLGMYYLGFGDDTNRTALPKAVYLLNPDTITQVGATQIMFDTLTSDTRLGMVGANLTYGDGSFQHGAFMFPGIQQIWAEFFPTPGRMIEGRFNGRYPRELYESSQPFDVDFTLGATMMLKAEVIQEVGMFDEGFFMYCEEIDWAWRIREADWNIQCIPTAHVVHLGGQSTSQIKAQSTVYLWQSRIRLSIKHHAVWKQRIIRRLIILGMKRKINLLDQEPDMDPALRQEMKNAYQTIIETADKAWHI